MMKQASLFALAVLLLASGMGAAYSAPAAARPAALPPAASDFGPRASFDPRVRQYIMPARIVWQTTATAAPKNPERLLEAGSGQITLDRREACLMHNQGQAPALLLDFGRELHGAVQLGVADLKPAPDEASGKTERVRQKRVRVRVRFGESASEAMSELGVKGAQTDHAIRDQIVYLPWLGTTEVGNTAFRFVRIDLIDKGASLSLKMARAVFLYRDLPWLGSFQCSDERLNKIWMTGAYTVQLNMQDYLWDGAKRDRLVWIGDMHPETQTIAAVFGDQAIVRRSLDLLRDETQLPKWMNGISSYSMWWVLMHQNYYRYYGDLDYLRAQQTYLKALLAQFMKYVGPEGSETLPAAGRFLDWPSSENIPAIHAGLHSLMILTLEAGGELCATLGDAATQAQCTEAVARLRKHVPDPAGSKQAAALMALAGLAGADKLNREVMAVDGAHRLSTFYGYYVLEARAKAGDWQGCLDTIRQYWGGMLDVGATTFWEGFDLDWLKDSGRIDEITPPGKKDIHGDFGEWCYKGFRHSLCHGWASGPTPWLTEHVLGIQVVEPGCKVVKIAPHLGDLKWAEGTFPAPQGPIKVRHEAQPDGTVKTTVQAPEGVKIVR